jgi:hypothetical protein
MEYSDERILEALLRMDDGYRAEPGMDVREVYRADNMVLGSLIRGRVRLVSTDLERGGLEPGDEGTVERVADQHGALSVRWDRVGDLLLFPEFDRWE